MELVGESRDGRRPDAEQQNQGRRDQDGLA